MSRSTRRSPLIRRLAMEQVEVRRLLAGDLSLAEPIVYPAGPAPSDVVAGDLNADGLVDLVVSNYRCCGEPAILLGNGDGTFKAPRIGFVPVAHSAELADINQDGFLDIVSVTSAGGTMVASPNLGTKDGEWLGFGEPKVMFGSGVTWRVGIAHFNGDEYPDVALVDNSLLTFENAGLFEGEWDGFFEPELLPLEHRVQHVEIGDLNADGHLDLVASVSGGSISVLTGDGEGSFEHVGDFSVGDQLGDWPELVDLNGDGHLDFVAAAFESNQVSVLNGNGDGTFEAPIHYATTMKLWGLTVGDLNGDRDLDVVALSFDTGPDRGDIQMLLNNGEGALVESQRTFSTGSGSVYGSTLADLDGDGDQDLAVATAFATNTADNGVTVFMNRRNFNVAGTDTIGSETLQARSLSRDGLATQSSTKGTGNRNAALMATDGDVRTKSRTDSDGGEQRWELDLHENTAIGRVVVVLRGSSQKVLSDDGVRVQVIDDGGTEVWSQLFTEVVDDRIDVRFQPNDRIEGQFIRLTKSGAALELNEVEVYRNEFVLAGRVLDFDVDADALTSDLLRLEGNLSAKGATLRVKLVNGELAEGMEFKLLDTTMTNGEFDRLVLPELPDDLAWNVSRLRQQGVLSVEATGPEGDFDGNGEVNFRDFLILASTFGATGNGLLSDADGNQAVDFKDFLILADNFGANRLAEA